MQDGVLIDDTFPDWKKCIPENIARLTESDEISFDIKLLDKFAHFGIGKHYMDLYASDAAGQSAFILRIGNIPHFMGIIMPLQNRTWTKELKPIPEWLSHKPIEPDYLKLLEDFKT